ncbi:MAG: cytidine deaminase [Chitinophagaceae bacterium]|nr:cytidine deaminase [Chitinophagaceae bacterium]
MEKHNFGFDYEVYNSSSELNPGDALLLEKARQVSGIAYAPYSRFYVGAAALLENGQIITGTNQENASYPVGICAERVLLGSAATLYPDAAILSIAISYNTAKEKTNHPISPCGMCRQSLLEYETRFKKPVRIIMGGLTGKVHVVESVRLLLPFAFTSEELI